MSHVLDVRRSGIPQTLRKDGLIVSMCWCERKFVAISKEAVREGRTIRCGHPQCQPPRQASHGR